MTDTRITRSSGNIFADLGLPNSEELLLKARIASLISEKIKLQGMSQAEAAFGHDVEIKVRPSKTRNKGRLIMAG
jgi:predicted XRE-type DNA-binding protein